MTDVMEQVLSLEQPLAHVLHVMARDKYVCNKVFFRYNKHATNVTALEKFKRHHVVHAMV